MLDFFEVHQHLDFDGSTRSRPVAILGPVAREQIEEAKTSILKTGQASTPSWGPTAVSPWQPPRQTSVPLMAVFARRLLEART